MNDTATTRMPRAYRWGVAVLAILLVVVSVLYAGSLKAQRKTQKEIDESFCLAYGELLVGLMTVYDGEQDAFRTEQTYRNKAVKPAQTVKALCPYTSYARKNPELELLVDALTLPADSATGFRLRMTDELYQALCVDFAALDADAIETLLLLVQEHTLYGEYNE